jgi:glycosyltransferase involved in cell wall biosynthesis
VPNLRVVLLLHSGIEFDSRVKREAVSLAAAGLDTYVVTPSMTGQREVYELHGVKIIEQPVPYALLTARDLQTGVPGTSRTASWNRHLSPRDALEYANARAALYSNRLVELDGEGKYFKLQRLAARESQRARRWAMRKPPLFRAPALVAARFYGRVIRASTKNRQQFDLISGRAIRRRRLRQLARRWNRRLAKQRSLVVAQQRSVQANQRPKAPARERYVLWQKSEPQLLDLDVAFARLLDRLAPAVIQANDFHTLPAAVHAKRRAASVGRSLKVLYDSHEDAAGLDEHYGASRSRAFSEVEATYMGEVDAVMTVSPQLARRLQDRYGLAAEPSVVLNAPPQGSAHVKVPSLRRLIGVGDEVPLGVYAGGVNKNRGLDLLIEAMGRIPDLHVAFVLTNISERTRDSLAAQTVHAQVVDRAHFVPAVLPHEVAAYLSDGDFGFIVASNDVANHNVSLPNKLFEYLHAGLPVVTSNLDAMRDFIETHGVGCVFPYPDVDALVECVRWVRENLLELRKGITPTLLQFFSWEGSQEQLMTVYGDLLSIELAATPIPLDLTVERRPGRP